MWVKAQNGNLINLDNARTIFINDEDRNEVLVDYDGNEDDQDVLFSGTEAECVAYKNYWKPNSSGRATREGGAASRFSNRSAAGDSAPRNTSPNQIFQESNSCLLLFNGNPMRLKEGVCLGAALPCWM